jgi:membrane-bound lytic murein transglycosylase D
MIRLLKILGMELIFLLLLFGFYQKGWTEERYTVKPGDTLYGISKSLGVSVEALKKANALEEESVKPRQVLTIPSRAGNKAADVAGKPSNQASKKLSAATVKSTFGETDSYVVRKGDTLNSISKKVGLSTKEIMTRNASTLRA